MMVAEDKGGGSATQVEHSELFTGSPLNVVLLVVLVILLVISLNYLWSWLKPDT